MELGTIFSVINIYGPSVDRVSFWNNLLGKSFMAGTNFIVGGDLNFSLG